MPRLLAVGHVTWDRREGGDVLGGSVTYGTLTARKLGWETAILTSAGPDFVPDRDLAGAAAGAPDFLSLVPLVALTRGWRGLTLHTRSGAQDVPALPRPEVDPTGAGDVFAAAYLVRYHEVGDPLAAAAFAACAASCAVEGVGTSTLGDRAEIERRLVQREAFLEEGDWDE